MKRRAFILLAVLVIVGSSLLAVTGLIFLAQSEMTGQYVEREQTKRSLMIHSALNVIVPHLDRQRDRILQGELPELDSQYELYESGNRLAIVRLLPIGESGRIIEPEAGKLDLNSVSAEQLTATGLLDAALADRIIEFRKNGLGRSFQSVEELLHVEGVSPEMLYGPLEELTLNVSAMESSTPLMPFNEPVSAVANILTVFAFEPTIQRDGRKRINLNVEWSDELGVRIDDRFGAGASQIIKTIIDSGVSFDDDSVIFRVLNQFDVPAEDWPDIVDAITTESGEYQFGRLDINTASQSAIRALPTMQPEQADDIVLMRENLRDGERASIAWPLLQGILDREHYSELGGLITTRSWTFRIRFALGEVEADDPDGPIDGVMICEAVIDLAAPKPRVAYLRDVTMLEIAARIVLQDGLQQQNALREDDLDDLTIQDADSSSSNDGDIDDEWEVGSMREIGFPSSEDDAGDVSENPNAAPTRRRVGRWRGG